MITRIPASPAPTRARSRDGRAGRTAMLGRLVARDTWQAATRGRRLRADVWDAALDEAVAWLARSHEATGRRGSARGYSLLFGWQPAFPETTGYIIGTLLAYAIPRGRDDLVEHAREMADWEIEVQGEDGGLMQGLIDQHPRRSIVFNTGMVLHGWLDIAGALGEARHLEAARRAGDFLVRTQEPDGSWRGAATHRGIPHTYKSRVCWAMLRLAEATGEDSYRESAVRGLDWVVAQQGADGWFENCVFEPGTVPNTHGIAYTLRGLLESHALVGEERWLDAAVRGSRPLIERQAAGRAPVARWDRGWRPSARSECLTGTAQLGGVWLRAHEIAGVEGFRAAGLAAVEHAASHQLRTSWPGLRGALPGSFPVYGRYAPLACPNWAAKFLADALMVRDRVLEAG